MDPSEVSGFLELGEVVLQGASKGTSEEGHESLGESAEEVSVLWVSKVARTSG